MHFEVDMESAAAAAAEAAVEMTAEAAVEMAAEAAATAATAVMTMTHNAFWVPGPRRQRRHVS